MIRSPEERLDKLKELIMANGSIRIDEAASTFEVSGMTIRRDLDELEALGLARRVRGGAVVVGPDQGGQRNRQGVRAKTRIAEKLMVLLPSVGTVALDASTTVQRLAALMEGARDLTVVTNGLDTFRALTSTPGVTATLTGGTPEVRTESLVGPAAIQCARMYLYDMFISSAAAVDRGLGSSEPSPDEAAVKRAFHSVSGRLVLAIDSTKLGTRARARAFELDEVSLLVTDLDPADSRLDDYRDAVELL